MTTFVAVCIEREIQSILLKGELILMGFRTGDTELFHWDSKEESMFRLFFEK